jgi:hypothetical protein
MGIRHVLVLMLENRSFDAQRLAEILDHVVAFELAMHQHIQAGFLLPPDTRGAAIDLLPGAGPSRDSQRSLFNRSRGTIDK